MSNKPNEEVIIQNVAGFISKTTSNISFKPNLRLADRNMFAHLATGKICIRIYDFKDGKGDQAVEVTARVDIETLPYLYECARSFTMREPFFEAKIFGEPVRGGQFNGLCQMTRLQIARQEVLSNGKPNASPWGIAISNGYAKKIQSKTGGYMAEKNSYREEKKGFFSMTDRDFLYCLKNCMDYVSAFKQLAADNGYLTENLNKLKEQREQYFNTEPSMSPKESVDEARQKNAAPKKNHENENVKKMDIMIVSGIEKTEEGKCWCYATYNGRRFILEFPGLLPKLELNKKFTACLKVGKDKCHYIGS